MPKYWEDYSVGEKFTTPGRTVNEGMISIIMGLAGFTLSLFWDEEEAKQTIFGTRIAPGRLTLLLMGGLEEQADFWDHHTVIALLGIDQVKIKAPLRSGDTIKVQGEVIEKRESKNPERGLVIHKSSCVNQKGEIVVETISTHLLRRKPK